jgi:hypothetical protein
MSGAFLDRVRYGYEQHGPLWFCVLVVTLLTLVVGGLILLLIDEQRGTIQLYLAFLNVCLGMLWLLNRPKPNWNGVLPHAAVAVLLFGYYFELVRYPLIQGVF